MSHFCDIITEAFPKQKWQAFSLSLLGWLKLANPNLIWSSPSNTISSTIVISTAI